MAPNPKKRNPSKKNRKRLILSLFSISLFFLGVKIVGDYYVKSKVQEKIQQSGLGYLVHYGDVTFNPFMLTTNIEHLIIGNIHAPWMAFRRVTFHPITTPYPSLNISFKFSDNTVLARNSRHILSRLGVHQLIGSGSFSSHQEGNTLNSKLTLNVRNVGNLRWQSHIVLLDQHLSLQELRSDLLASMAMGHPEAMAMIYGNSIALKQLTVSFKDRGLTQHLFEIKNIKQTHTQERLTIQATSNVQTTLNMLGIAQSGTKQNKRLTNDFIKFITKQDNLTINMAPKNPLSLKKLAQLITKKSLADETNLTIYSH